MGTHNNGPSYLVTKENGKQAIKLEQFLAEKNPCQKELPFLFKVLSIEDPLSIQAHPNKKFAEQLHEKFPSIYKDPNHKPEMAIAISEKFHLLYGFLSIKNAKILCEYLLINKIFQDNQYVSNNFENLLQIFIKENDDNESYKLYNNVLIELLKISDEENLKALIKLLNFIKNEKENGNLIKSKLEDFMYEKIILTEKLNEKFPMDKGIIFALFMNYFQTNYGEAIFIGANIPHAYIYGDCMECMANSDNVIRLGLTPKFIDKENFEKIIINNFNDLITDNYKFEGKLINDFQTEYVREGITDFKLNYFRMHKNDIVEFYNEKNAILIAILGNLSVELKNGESFNVEKLTPFFIEENTQLKFEFDEKTSNNEDDVLEFYIASY